MAPATHTARQTLTEYDAARLEHAYPHPRRILVALRLAKDLDTCRQLLNGEPVDPARIHQHELKAALKPRLVQLVAPISLLTGEAA